MGNFCIWSYCENDYQHIYDKKRCVKCQDLFKVTHGGFSQRMSCRFHTYRDGYCIDCHKKEGEAGHNCYHQAYH